jgi:hypothetical protein
VQPGWGPQGGYYPPPQPPRRQSATAVGCLIAGALFLALGVVVVARSRSRPPDSTTAGASEKKLPFFKSIRKYRKGGQSWMTVSLNDASDADVCAIAEALHEEDPHRGVYFFDSNDTRMHAAFEDWTLSYPEKRTTPELRKWIDERGLGLMQNFIGAGWQVRRIDGSGVICEL